MIKGYHKHYIQQPGCGQKHRGEKSRLHPVAIAVAMSALAGLTPLTGCDQVSVVEGSDTHVSIRYDGLMNGLDRATELAQKACSEHGRTARLRQTYQEGLGIGERFAFFNCV